LVKEIAILCNSEDKTTRKYACIALGNAGFHDQTLYPQLKVSIPLLVSLLKDSDEKTRSNAAAALGNLARNSDELDADFVNADASYQLINMLVNDKSLSAKRVSIMAIINLLGLK
jgi:fused-like protein